MNCPRCGIEIPPGSTVCSACGASVVPGDPLSAAPAASSAPTPSRVAAAFQVVGSLLCLLLIVRLAFFSTLKTYHSWTPEAAGYLFGRSVGAYLLPLIILFFYYRKRRPKPANTWRVFVTSAWALGLAVLSFAGEVRIPKTLSQQELNQHIGELAKQTPGQAPASTDQTQWDGAIRSFFADIKSFNEAYAKEIAQLDNSALKTLYTVDSFRTPQSVNQILSQLHATLDLDEKYASLQPIFDRFKQRILASDASKSEKDAVLQGFEESASKSIEPREKTIAKEREWLQSSIDLYEFIQSNQGSYSVSGGKLMFNKTGLASVFNEKIQKATELRSEFNQVQEAFHKVQNEKLGKFGLQPSDLGASSPK